jgi:hypothetical protein
MKKPDSPSAFKGPGGFDARADLRRAGDYWKAIVSGIDLISLPKASSA